MESANLSSEAEFIFTDFPQLQDDGLLFSSLLFIYTFIVFGNLLIFFAVRLDTHLHDPMYNLISIFSFLKVWYSAATISEKKTISITGCLLQMYCFHSFGNLEGISLISMAVDRYLAICNPLCYQVIMTPWLCAQLSASSSIFSCLILLPEIVWVSTLPFVHAAQPDLSNLLNLVPMLRPAWTDTSMILIENMIHAVAISTTVLIIVLPRIKIIAVILRIPFTEGRQKVFLTCVDHLAVFLIFFAPCPSCTWASTAPTHQLGQSHCTDVYSSSPFFNPITYSLRNSNVKNAIRRLFHLWNTLSTSGGSF